MLTQQDLAFFANYPDFIVDPGANSVVTEFQRLAHFRGWAISGKKYSHAQSKFNNRYHMHSSDIDTLEDDIARLDLASASSREASYFEDYPDFAFNPSTSLSLNFIRLAQEEGWGKKSKRYREERAVLFESEFTMLYGADVSKLAAWQSICEDMDIVPAPKSITQCKKAMAPYKINIYDFIECKRKGQKPKPVFRSVNKLWLYSSRHCKVFPLEVAKKNHLLHALLKDFRKATA